MYTQISVRCVEDWLRPEQVNDGNYLSEQIASYVAPRAPVPASSDLVQSVTPPRISSCGPRRPSSVVVHILDVFVATSNNGAFTHYSKRHPLCRRLHVTAVAQR